MSRPNGRLLVLIVGALTLVLDARGARAQDFSLQLRNGLVTLVARDTAVPQILDRWAQIGGTTIVNRENMKRVVVTLQLTEVPERAALAILLRDVGGYILAERMDDRQGTSVIDRILILPTSTAPVRGPAPPALVGTQDFGNALEQPSPISSAPDVQVFREPDVQEPAPLGSAPTGSNPDRMSMPARGSPTLGFTPPALPQDAPGVGRSQADTSLLPRANPFGATTASLRPGEVTSQAPPTPVPSPSGEVYREPSPEVPSPQP